MFVTQVKELPFVQGVNINIGMMQIGVGEGSGRLVEIVTVSQTVGFRIEEIPLAKPTLGDVFLIFTGRQLRDK